MAALRAYLDEQAAVGRFGPLFGFARSSRACLPDVETACFRIVQEAVTNILRHAAASHVEVELGDRAGGLGLRIATTGATSTCRRHPGGRIEGEPRAHQHARARLVAGGGIAIQSELGRGTEIRARFPSKTQGRGAGHG